MNHWKTIARLTRRSLITLGLALFFMLALYFGTFMVKDKVQIQLDQTQQAANALQSGLSTKQADLVNLQTKTSRFNQLRQQGLLGDVDREAWVEQLLASQQRTGLGAVKLTYTLAAPQAMGTSDPNASATPLPGQGPQTHDLEFELNMVHEADLLALLSDYQAHVKGFFRVEACSLSSRTETGLKAHCTLRFFNLPDNKPNPTTP